ncbi:MAG TPA: hypothetical protein VHE82_12520, partial [Gemmatimonadaceae bacterium]|nr:hypothetical protein [Gemmatimonadaceae bacterium]
MATPERYKTRILMFLRTLQNTINPALSPPHVPATSVIGVEVAVGHPRTARTDRIAVIGIIAER